jgi:flagellar FliL protein
MRKRSWGRRAPDPIVEITGQIMAAKAKQADEEKEEGAQAEAEPQPKAKKKFPLKWIAITGVLLLLLGGGGAGAFFFFKPAGAKVDAAAPAAKPVAFIELPDVLVNLAGASGERPQYLKVKVALEVADDTLVKQIQPLLPRIIDAFQTYLREMRPTDLEGSAGLYRLKEELTRRVNLAVEPAHINAVLFKELIIQ